MNRPANKTALAAAICLFSVSAAAFCFLFYNTKQTQNKGDAIIAVLPKNAGEGLLSAEALDSLCQTYPLTYETVHGASAKAARAGKRANVVATNYTRGFFFTSGAAADFFGAHASAGYAASGAPNTKILNGRFFTRAEQQNGEKAATLNKKAAFEIFGSFEIAGLVFTIGGEPYTATGVIDDGNADAPNIYVPAASWGDAAASGLLAMAPAQNAEVLKAALQAATGADSSGFDIVNLSLYRGVIADKPHLAARAALLGLCAVVFKLCINLGRGVVGDFSRVSKNAYILSAERGNIGVFAKAALCAALFAAAAGVFLTALAGAAEELLVMRSAAGVLADVSKTCFNGELTGLYKAYANSNVSFGVFAAAFSGGIAAALFV